MLAGVLPMVCEQTGWNEGRQEWGDSAIRRILLCGKNNFIYFLQVHYWQNIKTFKQQLLFGDCWRKRRWRCYSSKIWVMGKQMTSIMNVLLSQQRAKVESSRRNKAWLKTMFLKEWGRGKWLWCFALITEHTEVKVYGVNWGLRRNTVYEAANFLPCVSLPYSQAAVSQVVLRGADSSCLNMGRKYLCQCQTGSSQSS